MSREKIALNYALMIEMIRRSGTTDLKMIHLLKNGISKDFTPNGEGIPDWQTFIDFYRTHSERLEKAILNGYKITFLTKNALKRLLKIKYGLEENIDYQVFEDYLDGLVFTKSQFDDLQNTISINWKVIDKNSINEKHHIKIELHYRKY
ncbi:hypothetical protein LIS82_13835 [Cytobacillus solani]|uniref:hypothetical protein n=1 Tax=Cytobacillus solani TaxID=1637975 RepID=UPI002079DA1E|nr:hypothetical protein [Cytobacillus solani]USK52723.1 hypothetical protein LIS82_13835 [Cytobacillus solani]